MYTSAHNAGAKVVAMTIPPAGGYAGWNLTDQTIASAVNAWILSGSPTNVDYKSDAFTVLLDTNSQHGRGGYYDMNSTYDSGDGIHPSTAGYQAVANKLFTDTTWTNQKTTLYQIGLSNNVNLNQSLRTSDNVSFQAVSGSNGALYLQPYSFLPIVIGDNGVHQLQNLNTINAFVNINYQSSYTGLQIVVGGGQVASWAQTDYGIACFAYAPGSGTLPGTGLWCYGTCQLDSPAEVSNQPSANWRVESNKTAVHYRKLTISAGLNLIVQSTGTLAILKIF
jgi:hypothetical protein